MATALLNWLTVPLSTMTKSSRCDKFSVAPSSTVRCSYHSFFKLSNIIFKVEIQPPPHFHEPPSPPELNSTEPFIEHFPPPYYLDVHPSKPNSFPWLAAIYSPDRKFICTGALVAPKTVVTAAQCVAGQAPPPAGAAAGGGGGGGEAEAPAGEQQAGGNFFVRFGRHHLNISHSYDKVRTAHHSAPSSVFLNALLLSRHSNTM